MLGIINVFDLVQRKISDDGGDDEPEEAFDKKEHETSNAESFHPRSGRTGLVSRRLFHAKFKIAIPVLIFKSLR